MKDLSPLPDRHTCLCSLGGGKYTFFGLDTSRCYWQTQVTLKDCAKAVFVTHMGLFQPIAMIVCLCNAPPTHQGYMDAFFKIEIKEFLYKWQAGDSDSDLLALEATAPSKPSRSKFSFQTPKNLGTTGRSTVGASRQMALCPSTLLPFPQYTPILDLEPIGVFAFRGSAGWRHSY